MEFLVFRLYGAMASWGEIAVGSTRLSGSYPSKSAIAGLLGAALGIRRDQDELHAHLCQEYLQAVKVLSHGSVLKDFHTVQSPDSIGKFDYRTRRDELTHGRDRLGTLISSREYRTDAQSLVALKALENANWSPEKIIEALKTPKFHLYLGRKACPLAAPLNPYLVQANCFRQALDNYQLGELLIGVPDWGRDQRWLPKDLYCHYYWEGTVEEFSAEEKGFSREQVQQLTHHDQPLSRVRWQFEQRNEYLWMDQKEVG